MPKKYAKPNRKKRKHLTNKQETFVKALAEGKSLTEAAKTANYSGKNPGQSGYQALAQLRGRVPELLERHGLGEEVLIEKCLKPLLEAEENQILQGRQGADQCRSPGDPARFAPHRIRAAWILRATRS